MECRGAFGFARLSVFHRHCQAFWSLQALKEHEPKAWFCYKKKEKRKKKNNDAAICATTRSSSLLFSLFWVLSQHTDPKSTCRKPKRGARIGKTYRRLSWGLSLLLSHRLRAGILLNQKLPLGRNQHVENVMCLLLDHLNLLMGVL